MLGASSVTAISDHGQKGTDTASLRSVTLYPPYDRVARKHDETRACFSFKQGGNKLAGSRDWDLGYGFASINHEDWLMVGLGSHDKRTVIKELGKYDWSDFFDVPEIVPLPELKEGEKRHITIDASADTHAGWASSTKVHAKAKVGHMYLLRVVDDQADFYVLFRIEELEQGERCTISWMRRPARLR
jgi:hypothetical protein